MMQKIEKFTFSANLISRSIAKYPVIKDAKIARIAGPMDMVVME